ncbi:MAG: hypothetical protein DBX59_10295 [Bacillota bacterium]|nr:MAG: hypothetical protein DBX59_10295 [Bacillota bacterium]
MEKIYSESDFAAIGRQKKKYLIIYFVVLGLYVAASAAVWTAYFLQPYQSPNIWWIKLIGFVLAALFVVFSFIFLGIPYKRVKNYYKLLKGVEVGTSNGTVGEFDRYGTELEIRDGLEFSTLYFLEYNTKKQEFFERKVWMDTEKTPPEFSEGEHIKVYTHGNVLVGFDRLQNQ